MRVHESRTGRRWTAAAAMAMAMAVALAWTVPATAWADEHDALAKVEVRPEGIAWNLLVETDGTVLTVSGSEADLVREFKAGERPTLKAAGLRDGGYTWELRARPKMDAKARRRLEALRQRGGDISVEELRREGALPMAPLVQSGAFAVRDGRLVTQDAPEPQAEKREWLGQLVGGELRVSGDLSVEGAKKFTVFDADGSGTTVEFAALEGPEVGTYFRGTAQTSGGEVVIDLPVYFGRVTEEDGLTVQLTPLSGWSRLYVAEKSVDRLVVRDAAGGEAAFDFLVQGVRRGYADFDPLAGAASADEGGAQ